MRLLLPLLCLYASPLAVAQDRADDEDQLRALHAQLIQAHVEGRADLWMEVEAADFISINGGHVTFPDSAARPPATPPPAAARLRRSEGVRLSGGSLPA